MVPFNDNAAWLNGNGALTLGQNADDGVGNATYKYAKDDVFFSIPLIGSGIMVATATTGSWVSVASNSGAVTITGARAQNATAGSTNEQLLLSCAAANMYVKIPISAIFRSAGGTTGNVGKGVLVKGIVIGFAPVTSTLVTGLTVTAWTRSLASGVSEDGTAYGGTVSYQSPIGTTVTGLQLVATTGQYIAQAVFGTPAWLNTADTDLFVELAVGLGVTPYNLKINKLGVRAAIALQ